MLNPEYIGITDFTSAEQVKAMLEVHRKYARFSWNRLLAVGVMMSFKTLNNIETKWSKAFPPSEAVASIFTNLDGVFNVLHYADYDNNALIPNLEKAVRFAGPHLHAIQLDMVWPNPHEVQDFRQKHAKTRIVLQANRKAFEVIDNDHARFIQRLESYGSSIDYVLLDLSGGKGISMDANALLPFAEAVFGLHHHASVAVAGGLGPDTLHLADPLMHRYHSISLDAQSRLRPSGNALDPVDWDMAALYLQRAAERFGNR